MAKSNHPQLPERFRLVSVTIHRPKGRFRFATLAEALDEIRRWVAFGQKIRIVQLAPSAVTTCFGKTFHLVHAWTQPKPIQGACSAMKSNMKRQLIVSVGSVGRVLFMLRGFRS